MQGGVALHACRPPPFSARLPADPQRLCGTDDVTLDDAVEQPDEEEEGGAQNGQEEKAVKRKRTVEDEVCLPQSRLHAHRNAPPKVKVLGAGGGLAGWCHRRFRR
jgi:hypothetical protein